MKHFNLDYMHGRCYINKCGGLGVIIIIISIINLGGGITFTWGKTPMHFSTCISKGP